MEMPQGPDDRACPLLDTANLLHMEVRGTSGGMSHETMRALATWVEGRIGPHWQMPETPYDAAVRSLCREALAEVRGELGQMENDQ